MSTSSEPASVWAQESGSELASVWAQELDLMAPQIVGRLNEALARDAVRRLRCVAVGHGR